MNDMSAVIVPKSDQLNADTLLAGPQTFTIKKVHISGGQEQPVSIELQETPLFYRPCKSMSRVLVQAWGADAKVYVGRSLTLYRDPSVKWSGMEVGGIRISHMSHVEGKMVIQLTATKGQRKPHVVMPLVAEVKQHPTADAGKTRQTPEEWTEGHVHTVYTAEDFDALERIQTKGAKAVEKLKADRPDLHEKVLTAYQLRTQELRGPAVDAADTPEDPFDGEDPA